MRISVQIGDPGYQPSHITCNTHVTLNGRELQACCITADEEEGMALVYRRDANNRLVSVCGELVTETLRGVVRIEAPKL